MVKIGSAPTITASDAFRKEIQALSFAPMGGDPAELNVFVKREDARLSELISTLDVALD